MIRNSLNVDLRNEFGPNSYNILTKNCNHFAAALVWSLLRRPIPSYVNRVAYLGSCFKCLIPPRMLGNAPVGPNAGYGDGIKVSGGGGRTISSQSSFSGASYKLGSSSSSNSSTKPSTSSYPIISSVIGPTVRSTASNADDLTDRREKARMAAMARLEKQRETSSVDTSKSV
jgi:hypothetical protein